MLTPAQELGLAGQSLAGRVRLALHGIPVDRLRAILLELEAEAGKRRMVWLHGGQPEPVRVMASPLTLLPEQLHWLHATSLALLQACKRLIDLYLADPDVRAVLQLPPEEEEWLRALWTPAHTARNPVFGRLDAVVELQAPSWKRTLQFVEPNLAAAGGLHLLSAAEQVAGTVLLPELQAADPQLELRLLRDARHLLVQELAEHLEELGRPLRRLCFVEPSIAEGPAEQEQLALWMHRHYGIGVVHAAPGELGLQGSEVVWRGQPIDAAVRNLTLPAILALQRDGVDVAPLRVLFKQDRMVSSLAGDLDQKAAWEVFTDPLLAARHFNADERRLFERHLPWTRGLRERSTTLPDGRAGDLPGFVRRERERLVIKPNRGGGGHGVVLGGATPEGAWSVALDRALAEPGRWVVQALAGASLHEFPVLGAGGKVSHEPFYVVLGFTPTPDGLSILGRASHKQVVDLALQGGICAVAVGQSANRAVE